MYREKDLSAEFCDERMYPDAQFIAPILTALKPFLRDTLTGLMRRVIRPQRLLLVPWRHTPADEVARSMLFHLWRVHRYAYKFGARMAPDEIVIVDRHDVGIFRDLIGPRRDELQAWIGAQRCRGGGRGSGNRQEAVLFECV